MKINIDDYEEFGLGDLYYTLISFIANYAQKYKSFENFETGESKYATTIEIMKSSLKELLDYLKTVDEIYLPSLNKNVKLSTLNQKEQLALEERCKEYLVLKLSEVMNENIDSKTK